MSAASMNVFTWTHGQTSRLHDWWEISRAPKWLSASRYVTAFVTLVNPYVKDVSLWHRDLDWWHR